MAERLLNLPNIKLRFACYEAACILLQHVGPD